MTNQSQMIWSCSNEYDTETRYVKGTLKPSDAKGVCAGLAIEFCKNILSGTKAEMAKPALMRSMLYQALYDRGFSEPSELLKKEGVKSVDDENLNLFQKASVHGADRVEFQSFEVAAEVMFNKAGVFWGGYDCHAIALAKVSGSSTLLFFDPNFGCYKVNDKFVLASRFQNSAHAVEAKPWLEFYQITL